MPASQTRLKTHYTDFPIDEGLEWRDGWHDLRVRWLVTRDLAGSESTVVGRSEFPPGARHALHRHPNAEEWEYVLSGTGTKLIGEVDVPIRPGDIIFTPRDVYHGVANTSSEPLVTLWGYTGAASLEEAGYVLLERDARPDAPRSPGPGGRGRDE